MAWTLPLHLPSPARVIEAASSHGSFEPLSVSVEIVLRLSQVYLFRKAILKNQRENVYRNTL